MNKPTAQALVILGAIAASTACTLTGHVGAAIFFGVVVFTVLLG